MYRTVSSILICFGQAGQFEKSMTPKLPVYAWCKCSLTCIRCTGLVYILLGLLTYFKRNLMFSSLKFSTEYLVLSKLLCPSCSHYFMHCSSYNYDYAYYTLLFVSKLYHQSTYIRNIFLDDINIKESFSSD